MALVSACCNTLTAFSKGEFARAKAGAASPMTTNKNRTLPRALVRQVSEFHTRFILGMSDWSRSVVGGRGRSPAKIKTAQDLLHPRHSLVQEKKRVELKWKWFLHRTEARDEINSRSRLRFDILR